MSTTWQEMETLGAQNQIRLKVNFHRGGRRTAQDLGHDLGSIYTWASKSSEEIGNQIHPKCAVELIQNVLMLL